MSVFHLELRIYDGTVSYLYNCYGYSVGLRTHSRSLAMLKTNVDVQKNVKSNMEAIGIVCIVIATITVVGVFRLILGAYITKHDANLSIFSSG
jgi:hypothetical protein